MLSIKTKLKLLKKICTFLAVFLVICDSVICDFAFAGSGAHHSGDLPSLTDFIASKKVYWINFLVYFGISAFFISKAFPKGWKARRDFYLKALQLGKEKLAASELKLSEARNLHDSIPEKIEEIKKTIEAEVHSESERIIKEAYDKAAQIESMAQQNVEAERRTISQKFKRELIQAAVLKAELKARHFAASGEVDTKLRSKVLERVESLVN